ncbi:LD-carboxypeptidase [Paenibacillus sp. PK3_47]|uniref:S66 family peptidase n=1 Tax=Paenibacillus sp. PK3_47 TaxID=2072642 RepID=UPI00201D49D7|nr:S66 peptidase family protein [Paenibacillus sp. PK3_47]UQZ32157.1 LD-carboxypeptidase [Paenibacillus sp. PK3_47]
MITYPLLKSGARIGVTASSSGVGPAYRTSFEQGCTRMGQRGYGVFCGDTVFHHSKTRSASGKVRAAEFNSMMQDDSIDLIIPPWGGELLIEMLEHIDFSRIRDKWILGFSDISLLLLAVTLQTGLATAHGPGFGDISRDSVDEITGMWQTVMSTRPGGSVVQSSGPDEDEQKAWKSVSGADTAVSGRLLGGCIDVIRHMIGTPYGDVGYYQQNMIGNEPVLWFLENCELRTADLPRSLVQMKLAGWFEHCSGILFGRSPANEPVDQYTIEDVYRELSEELQVPIIYDIDCGHIPPQMTLVNGAYAEVKLTCGSGTITQYFRE